MTLAEAKRQCRIFHSDDDDYCSHLISVGRDHVEGYCSALYGARDLILEATSWADLAGLPVSVTGVSAIDYIDAAGDEQTLSEDDFQYVDGAIVPTAEWPEIQADTRIAVAASVISPCPPSVKHAILLLVSDMYERREPEPAVERTTLDNLLSNHRHYG